MDFIMLCTAVTGREPIPEYRFHPTRRWRFDYAFPAHKIAVEIEGGFFCGGRHSRGVGAVKDMEKYNEAAILGWRLLRFTPQQVKSGHAVETINRIFQGGEV